MRAGILFADISGFTSRSESSDPEEMSKLLRRFYRCAEDVLFPDAIIDKLIGDEVMALYLPDVLRNVDPDRVSSPQRWDIKGIQHFMVVFGLISSVFDLMTFAVLLLVFHADQATFQTSWFIVSLLTELAVVLVLRTHRPAFRSRSNRKLMRWQLKQPLRKLKRQCSLRAR